MRVSNPPAFLHGSSSRCSRRSRSCAVGGLDHSRLIAAFNSANRTKSAPHDTVNHAADVLAMLGMTAWISVLGRWTTRP